MVHGIIYKDELFHPLQLYHAKVNLYWLESITLLWKIVADSCCDFKNGGIENRAARFYIGYRPYGQFRMCMYPAFNFLFNQKWWILVSTAVHKKGNAGVCNG